MKKTKKITNLHDYSKEVDKIIATGKPMVEQFMDLMKLMDVTFIDSKLGARNNLVTSSIKRPKKQDSSVQDKQTSDCCGAEVLTVQGYPKDEGTHYWQCSKCGKPCNIMNPCGSQTKRKRDATTGSTAAVHLNVFGIGGKIDRFFLSGDDITLYKIKRFIRKIFLDILEHNQDPMTGLYDYDGIAQEVIDLVKK
ncbi:MAG TPA: hypothetical protein PLX95_04050 [bacterium]|nr:hypothetical protein [bacterium]